MSLPANTSRALLIAGTATYNAPHGESTPQPCWSSESNINGRMFSAKVAGRKCVRYLIYKEEEEAEFAKMLSLQLVTNFCARTPIIEAEFCR